MKEKGILEHVWNWKETPDAKPLTIENYDSIMLASGKAGESLEMRLAGARGQANALQARMKKHGWVGFTFEDELLTGSSRFFL